MSLVGGLAKFSLGALAWTVARSADLNRTRPRRIVHEAGHALLMARSPYMKLERATIVPKLFGAEGHCIATPPKQPTVGSALDEAVVFMGGLAGEAVAKDFYELGGGRSDIRGAKAALGQIAASPVTLRQTFVVAQVLIRQNRPAFDRLCNALDKHDTLEGPQVRAIVGSLR
jgi:ATP-dependent Zn protease